MTETPERIWAFPKKDWFNAGASTNRITAAGAKDVEYIRKDVSDALIAAIVHAAADKAVDWANGDVERPDDGVWLNVTSVIDTGARQALDALLKAEREKALREAAQTARDYGRDSYAAKMISDAILALIDRTAEGEA